MTRDEYYDALAHHGIGGMKWGKRNGPPYPLDGSSHSSSERKAGTKGWTKEAKKDVAKKVGKAAAGTAAVAGAAAGAKYASDKKYRDAAKELNGESPSSNKDFSLDKETTKAINKGIDATKKSTSALRKATTKKVSTAERPASEMTNKELQDFITRQNLEATYNRMTTKEVENKGVKYVTEAIDAIGDVANIAISVAAIAGLVAAKRKH